MAYLVTFHWGWLLASLLLGLAMGWIAVVHRGRGVSKVMARWLAALAAALVAPRGARSCPAVSAIGSISAWSMFACYLVGCAVGSWLRDWVVSRRRRQLPASLHAGLAGESGPIGRQAVRDASVCRRRARNLEA